MMEIAFVGNGQGPPIGLPHCRIRSCPPGGEVSGWITSHRICAVWTHYLTDFPGGEPRTIPHVTPEHECEGCRRNIRQTWKAYLGCWDNQTATPFLADLTAESVRYEPRLNSGQDLRGFLLTLRRPGRNRRGRVYATL